MSRQRQDQLLTVLLREGGWVTSGRLADLLGVTQRSVRGYVAALNARVIEGGATAGGAAAGDGATAGATAGGGLSASGQVVESGPSGYRAGPGANAALNKHEDGTPKARLTQLIRAIAQSGAYGINVHHAAELFHVSDATLESDLGRIRSLITSTPLHLERDRETVRLIGTEIAIRRFLGQIARELMDGTRSLNDVFRLVTGAAHFDPEIISSFKTALVAALGELGFYVNELAISDVVLQLAISVDRVANRQLVADVAVATNDNQLASIAEVLTSLVSEWYLVELPSGDSAYLARLVRTRMVGPSSPTIAGTLIADNHGGLEPGVEHAVRASVARVMADYAIDLADESFLMRLALHVQNMQRRFDVESHAQNPLTRSLKGAYPVIFEASVALANQLHERLGTPMDDDEIAYLAMHVGGQLERLRGGEQVLTATIVCPGYYELHEVLRSRVNSSLGVSIEVVQVITQIDPDWEALKTDLVLSTIASPLPAERVVKIQPFLTEVDVEHVQQAAARLRRTRRLTKLRDELAQYFSADAFLRPIKDDGDENIIRQLGALLVQKGVIDEEYVDNTVIRERMSSTQFTDTLAVPHALKMTANRTAIALGVADGSVTWGEGRVQVVAFAAFSETDRAAFQTVLEQLVEVFGEGDSVQRLVRRGTTFTAFLDELVAVIDG